MKVRQVFVFSIFLFFFSCSSPVENSSPGEIQCHIIDVENGLAQIIASQTHAVALDMGEQKYITRWLDGYKKIGSPFIEWICISHTDEDHVGGLRSLPQSVSFSGLIYTGVMSDTVLLRSHVAGLDRTIRFQQICRGDIIDGPSGVRFTCLWPPDRCLDRERGEATKTNRYSLCFRVDYMGTSFLITSDIDSSSMRIIAGENRYGLDTDWMVVPHHGSGGSLHREFYGFASPARAVISCGKNNVYNHPAPQVVLFLTTHLSIPYETTVSSGNILYRSNGYYWSFE